MNKKRKETAAERKKRQEARQKRLAAGAKAERLRAPWGMA